MVGMFGSQADAGTVVQPKPTLLGLFLWNFEPFPPPYPRHALVVYMPAGVVRQAGDHAITVAPELSSQFDDVLGQPLFIWLAAGHLALCRAVLSQCAAGPTLGYAKGLPHMINAVAAA